MIPAFRLIASGADVTARLADRLLSLTVTDEDGETADRLELQLDDRDARLELPPVRARLQVALGFRETGLTELGLFEVESLEGSAPPRSLRVTATAVDLKRAARAPRTRAYEDRTLAQIVAQVAADAGLEPAVAPALAGLRWPYLAQTAESGLHFLTRLGREIDATVKAAGGRLVVTPRGAGIAADGTAVPPVVVPVARLASWSWALKSREVDGAVEAEWSDTAQGRVERTTDGLGGVVRRLRQVFSSEDEARRAARGARARAAREALTIRTTGAFEPALFAGGLARFPGIRPEFDGDWSVTRVRHVLSDGLRTEVEAKREFEQEDGS